MTNVITDALVASTYTHAVDIDSVKPRFETLIDNLVSHPFSIEALSKALAGGIAEAGAVLRAVPIHEGRLIEQGITLIGEYNPDLVVLTQNLRLPVTKTALELVGMNDPKHYRSLTLDAETGGRKSYSPDLIILNRTTRLAHVVDVKRSLSSYEISRINDLKTRMLAAALVVPDLLYKEHHRLVADEVRVVILNAENQRADIAGGIWPLAQLDHLLEVSGAGQAISMLRALFHSRIGENWDQARKSFAQPTSVLPDSRRETSDPNDIRESTTEHSGPDTLPDRGSIRVGFAKIPRAAAG